ncbi:MAG: 4Fe-4S dicluster domain-containing protein [Phycisphaerae bacterium]
MSNLPVDDLPPHDRRRFFAAGFGRVLAPFANYVGRRMGMDAGAGLPLLRPPGALPEQAFLETCHRCGRCAEVCPADAIRLVADDAGNRPGTPFIDPAGSACVICDELACMKVCPSGALRLVDRLHIRIGAARVAESVCVRTSGDDCTICIDRCPLGDVAIRLQADAVYVAIPLDNDDQLGLGCVGCGVCEHECPTTPKAIVVESGRLR